MIIDHIGLPLSDYETSKPCFSCAEAPLGSERLLEVRGSAGFGTSGEPGFWLGPRASAQTTMHIALAAETWA